MEWYTPKPTIRAMVAWITPSMGVITEPKVVTLEEAADYARFGWAVLIDPADQNDLTRWEQLHRWGGRKWFEAL